MSFRDELNSRLGGLTPVRRELRALRQAHERLRDELAAQQERTEESERKHRETIRRLEGARDKYRVERDQAREQVKSVEASRSFRVGHAIVRVTSFPVLAVRAVASFVVRIARGLSRRVIRPAARAVARAAKAVWTRLRALARRVRILLWRAKRAAGAPLRKETEAGQPAKADAPAPEDTRVISVPQGNEFLGPLTDGHATTMFLLWGLSEDEIDSIVDEVARLQMMQWDFKPLFVTDSDHWGSFQEHGYWFEYVPPAEDWLSHNSGGDWSQFVSERVDSIVELYSPNRIVVYEDTAKRGALRHGVLNGVISAGEPVLEKTMTGKKLAPPTNGAGSEKQRAASSSSN